MWPPPTIVMLIFLVHKTGTHRTNYQISNTLMLGFWWRVWSRLAPRHFLWQAWRLVTLMSLLWQAWHLLTSTSLLILFGKRVTYGIFWRWGWDWRRGLLRGRHRRSLREAGVALGGIDVYFVWALADIGAHFVWQEWQPLRQWLWWRAWSHLALRHFVWQLAMRPAVSCNSFWRKAWLSSIDPSGVSDSRQDCDVPCQNCFTSYVMFWRWLTCLLSGTSSRSSRSLCHH